MNHANPRIALGSRSVFSMDMLQALYPWTRCSARPKHITSFQNVSDVVVMCWTCADNVVKPCQNDVVKGAWRGALCREQVSRRFCFLCARIAAQAMATASTPRLSRFGRQAWEISDTNHYNTFLGCNFCTAPPPNNIKQHINHLHHVHFAQPFRCSCFPLLQVH